MKKTKIKKKVACYARVSTHDQQTLQMQIDGIKEYVDKRGWSVVKEVCEVGSGKDDKRSKREALLKSAKRREIDVIVVWKLDRWGRSLVELVNTLQELSELKVGFVSLTETIDLTTPTGKALTSLLSVFAEFERDILRERIKAGIAQAKKEGKTFGHPRTAASKADKIGALYEEGWSQDKIALKLGIGASSVRRILKQISKDRGVELIRKPRMKELHATLWLDVENNSKFVRGKKKAREDIEYFLLSYYNAKKLDKSGYKYSLIIPYRSKKKLENELKICNGHHLQHIWAPKDKDQLNKLKNSMCMTYLFY